MDFRKTKQVVTHASAKNCLYGYLTTEETDIKSCSTDPLMNQQSAVERSEHTKMSLARLRVCKVLLCVHAREGAFVVSNSSTLVLQG